MRTRTVLLLPAVAMATAIATPCAGQIFPPGFEYEAVATPPFSGSPIGFAFLPDGRILLIEKQGRVRVVPVGSLITTGILLVPNVDSLGGEEGLLGVAVDPDWPARPYLYFCYTRVDSVTCVTMYTASGELSNPTSTSLVLSSPFHLLTDIPNLDDEHNAGTLRFGPDGMLYLSLGDDKNSCEGPQSLHILSGKILRLDVSLMPGAGTGPPPKADITPPDNPFPGPNENERLVWAWGLRNPYRFTIDPATNDLFIGDVGRDAFEELDLSDWSAGGGENYGWPELEALEPTGYPCDTVNVWTDPIWWYAHQGELPHVIIPGPRYRVAGAGADVYPPEYDGSVFALEFYHGQIWRLVEGAGGWEIAAPVPGQPTAEHWAEGLDFVSDFQQGPDGSLYVCHVFNEPRGIYRIRFTGATGVAAAPASGARLSVVPNPVRAGQAAAFRWDLQGSMRSLRIVDVAGRTVSALREPVPGGAVWEARGRDGRPLPAGVYFVRLDTDDGRSLRTKVSVVR